jgi:glycosyltransferase involved in cell wall biosynthesis
MVAVFTRESKQFNITRSNKGIKTLFIPVHLVASYAPVNFFLPFFLKRIIHIFSPDIIHVHMPGIMPFFCLHELKKRTTIVHWHADVEGTRVSKHWIYPVYRLFEQRLLKNADAVIATSSHYLNSSNSLKPWKKKSSVIPLGITDITHSAAPETLSPKIDKFIKNRRLILSVGRFAYYKGYTFLVEAMEFIKDCDAVLLIAGDGDERQAVEQKIKDLGLEKRIMLPGKISDTDKRLLLSRAEIFCLPSIDRAEAFGVSLLEAMQFTLPLVTTKVKGSGMNHVNIHQKTGLSVKPANSLDLARALNKLLMNPALAKEFGNNAKQRFSDHFQAGTVAEKIKQHYLTLLERKT